MTDRRLRELERRWQETGNVQDEAAYLVERVRAGDLRRERLELAARWGHAGARQAVESGDPWPGARAVIDRTLPDGKRAFAPLCVHMARALLGEFEARFPPDEQLTTAVETAEAWVRCPCPPHQAAVRDVAGRRRPRTPAEMAAIVVATACLTAGLPDEPGSRLGDYTSRDAAATFFGVVERDPLKWSLPSLDEFVAGWVATVLQAGPEPLGHPRTP